MKSQKFTAYFILALTCLISSCVSHPSYPQHWGRLSESNTCPSVDGYYTNMGETENNTDYQPSLYKYLIGSDRAAADNANLIRIAQGIDSLLIEAYLNDALLAQKVVHYNPADCENGFLKLKVPDYKPIGWLGIDWADIHISKAADRALILRYHSGGAGFVLIVPVAGSEWTWYRFPASAKQ